VKHILYFTADWCNPCQRTKPVAEELHSEGIINFEFVDADSDTEMIKKFDIKAVPTFILIDHEKEVRRMNGTKTRQDFLNFISEETSHDG
jgi:thiol-disulfide isomerase/thioredoxin